MTGDVEVRHLSGDRFEIAVRQHRLECDQPSEDGGTDAAPTPTELFIASLTACVGFYARRYLARHQLAEDIVVRAHFEMASRPARVGRVELLLVLPAGFPEERMAGLLAVASHCTVHNSLLDPPQVTIEASAHSSAAA